MYVGIFVARSCEDNIYEEPGLARGQSSFKKRHTAIWDDFPRDVNCSRDTSVNPLSAKI
jgi:adenylate kinase family enzyme